MRQAQHVLVAILLIVVAACTPRDPSTASTSALGRGDELMGAQRYPEAAQAYRRAVGANPRDGLARMKLADAYERAGQFKEASEEAIRAADLLPGNVEARLLAARLMLPQGRFVDAETFMSALLRDDPNNAEALLLWGNATARLINPTWAFFKLTDALDNPVELDRARRELRPPVSPKDDRAAEAAFRKSLALAPSAETRLALANFLWASGNLDASEDLLKRAADELPLHATINHALGAFYLARKREADGEKYLENAVRTGAPYNRAASFALADHYAKSNRDEEALNVLAQMTEADDASGAVSLRAAAIEIRRGRREDALRRVNALLVREPNNGRAVLIKSQILFAMGNLGEALPLARVAVATDPKSSDARFLLGQALSANGQLDSAFDELREALRLNPDAMHIPTAVARLALATGHDNIALEYAREALRKRPDDHEAAVYVTQALVRLRNYSAADQELEPLLSRYPASADLFVQLGMVRAAQGNDTAARAAYERALAINRDALDALSGIVSLDLAQGQIATARQRIDQALASHPNDSGYLQLASRVFAAEGDVGRTESTLRRVLALDRGNVSATVLLADDLAAHDRRDEAVRVLEQLLASQPSSIRAQTTLATLLEQMGRTNEARAGYEKILVQDPGAATAAARLALLYITMGENLDVALTLVTTAKQRSPDDPAVSDALGWVYVQKGHVALAVPHLEDAARADARNAMYRYHLGTAYLAAGQRRKARDELTRALEFDETFPDRAKAQAALETLSR